MAERIEISVLTLGGKGSSLPSSSAAASGRAQLRIEVKMLLETVWNSVAWEVVTAFAALEPVELTEKIQAVGANGDNPKPEKKMKVSKEKRRCCMSGLLIWVGDFLSLFDLKDPEFDVFLSEIKVSIESTEEGRKKAFSVIEEVSERHCATALATPAFEWRETLMGEYGEGSKLIDELADQGAKLFSLRYHSSVSFARYVVDIGLTFFKAC
ncbi:hypothetical protein K1719_037615 [Acacia pycnantha]|nr:hypothetical protein K1719_037615 [Acacia pycnantha]